jgi:hypothetical protein
MKRIPPLLSLVLALAALACTKTPVIEVKNEPLAQIEVKEIADHGDEFPNVTVFFWEKGVPSAQRMIEVMNLAQKFERLSEGTRADMKKLAEMRADPTYVALEEEEKSIKNQAPLVQKNFLTSLSLVVPLERDIINKLRELDQEHQKEQPDREKIRALREGAAKVWENIQKKRPTFDKYDGIWKGNDKRLLELKALLTPFKDAIQAIEDKIAPDQAEQIDITKHLQERTAWPTALPTLFKITRGDRLDSPAIEISHWQFSDEEIKRTFKSHFSEEDGSRIEDIAYNKRGGVLTFTLCRHDIKDPKRLIAAAKVKMTCLKSDSGKCITFTGDMAENNAATIAGGDEVEQPGDGEAGNEERREERRRHFRARLQEVEQMSCKALAAFKLEGKTQYGVMKISSQRN